MSESPELATTPVTRRRWRVLIALASLLLLTAVIAGGWWWTARRALSDEERQLVGTWRLQWDVAATSDGILKEYEFQSNRTCRVRTWDQKTGTVLTTTSALSWRLADGKLIVRYPAPPAGPWGLFPSQGSGEEVYRLTRAGPDQLPVTWTVDPQQTPIAGTLIRVVSAE